MHGASYGMFCVTFDIYAVLVYDYKFMIIFGGFRTRWNQLSNIFKPGCWYPAEVHHME